MKYLRLYLIMLVFATPVFAEIERDRLVNNVLLELQHDIEFREGGLCIVQEKARPFSRLVLIDCETLLSNLILDDADLVFTKQGQGANSILEYAKFLVKELISPTGILEIRQEDDVVLLVRLLSFFDSKMLDEKNVDHVAALKGFYLEYKDRLGKILNVLSEEENVLSFKNGAYRRWQERFESKLNPVVESAETEIVEQEKVEVKPIEVEVLENKKGYERSFISVIGLLSVLLVIFLFYLVRRNRISGDVVAKGNMTPEERAELRELRLYFGLTQNVTIRDITRSYRLKVRESHPDRNQSSLGQFLLLQKKYSRIKELQEKFKKAS